MVQQENAEMEASDSPLLVTVDEAVVWFKSFVLWMRIYGIYVFALSLTFGVAGLIWLGYPQSQNFCVMHHGVVLTMFVPILCMLTLYMLGAQHPSNLTTLFFYIAVNLVPATMFDICSEGYTIAGAYVMSVAIFVSFTGLTYIGGTDPKRWKCIAGIYTVIFLMFLICTGLQSVPWYTKLVVIVSAFSITFFAFILCYDTSVLIYQASYLYCIRSALRLYVDTIAIFLAIIFMLSMPKWVEHAHNSTQSSS
ncbi:membrane protein US20 [Mandrillus leucophaeus cytomegalovirus]|uniref:Membrane protein US20 n=1 Tax=Mandrillus leucophaeus cytomegalovirus TaxID=1654930 RepID=A0A0G2UHY0_9BETA|nr:membrane protein US20 [Mandrillus leucophaeus cytomegalovirus]AKI29724.1 membrane protein US20 [Mandrillus leucophaeus cytomegalovirus]